MMCLRDMRTCISPKNASIAVAVRRIFVVQQIALCRGAPNKLYKFEPAMPGVLSAGSAFVDAQQSTASSCNAYDFGFDNPQYSDRVLHVLQEPDGDSAEAEGPAKQATVLRSMHVNSLTIAANSEVLRCMDCMMN